MIELQPQSRCQRDEAAGFAAARDICRRHARTFYFASFFLPAEKRRAAYSLYAFCRLLDDSVDESPTGAEARAARFESLLDQIYDSDLSHLSNAPDDLALRAFHATVSKYSIPKRYFEELARGCRMDLTVTRYDTWRDLENYCYHVAGVVGLIMSCIFGPIDEATKPRAIAMGNAMQLTNILRDVKGDLERGRIYLPREDLERFGVSESALSAGRITEGFRSLMQFQVERARALYRRGADGLCRLCDDGSRFTASAMAVMYAGILSAIERQDYDVFSRRAHLTIWEKAARLPAARRLARRREGQPLPEVF